MGSPQKQTEYELRQAEPRPALLLRQKNHKESHGPEVRLQVCVLPRDCENRKQNPLQGEDGIPGPGLRLQHSGGRVGVQTLPARERKWCETGTKQRRYLHDGGHETNGSRAGEDPSYAAG